MLRIDRGGVVFYQFDGLKDASSVDQAIFTRLGGVSRGPYTSLNLGHTVGDDLNAVAANHRRALAVVGWRRQDVAACYQVHSAQVGVVGLTDRGRVRPETDALLTDQPGVLLMQRFADCVPVTLFDHRRRIVGLAHAGWRGIVAGVLPATIASLTATFGSHPADLWVGIGPAIGPCCYEVGPEVIARVSAALNVDPAAEANPVVRQVNGRAHLDLWAAVRRQLEAASVGQIEMAKICTACRVHEWFSHRAEKGKTGRFGAIIGLRP